MLELILERSGTLIEQDFATKLKDFGSRPPAQRVLYMQGLTTTSLGKLTRPGAWLLDYVYTAVGVICGDTKPTVTYTAVLNSIHRELLELCFPDVANTSHASSDNNRGNQMEALCWILFEANLAELILAQAYHSHRLTMAAKLSEAGAPPSHEVTELSSIQS